MAFTAANVGSDRSSSYQTSPDHVRCLHGLQLSFVLLLRLIAPSRTTLGPIP
jgi:hypothetical protein